MYVMYVLYVMYVMYVMYVSWLEFHYKTRGLGSYVKYVFRWFLQSW